MSTGWETFPIELTGGLISNESKVQQGLTQPGSARRLTNFECSIKGGYRRINGYNKFNDNEVPCYGEPMVQASGQTGTSLVIANLFTEPQDGDTFTVAGVSGTYTIDTGGVSFSSTNKEATLTLTTSLDSSPADQAAVTFTNNTNLIEGIHSFISGGVATALAFRDGVLFKAAAAGSWTNISKPSYGTVLVAGGSQTGTSFAVDGITSDTYGPKQGDTFTVDGIEKVYTVLSDASVSSGASTLSIYPALASSPANNAAITFEQMDKSSGTQMRFERFNFDGTTKVVMVDGSSYPAEWSEGGTTLTRLDTSSDISAADHVAEFKDHIFYAAEDLLTFTVPFDSNDFTSGSGAGSMRFAEDITGLIVFRDKLIIFTENTIHQITGASQADFTKVVISNEVGCVYSDTIQEVGGDIVFLGPDGVRFLGATARIGDFNLSLASKKIQDDVTTITGAYTKFCSVTLRSKSQYRLMAFVSSQTDAEGDGFIGTQKMEQEAMGFDWSTTKGIHAYRASEGVGGGESTALFVGKTGYVYRLDSGNDFDGTAISSYFFTPFMSLNDPVIRKTLYKITSYYDPEATFTGTLTPRFDLDIPSKIQPPAIPISGGGSFVYYGATTYGTGTFGGDPEAKIEKQAVGSFFTVSLQYEFLEDSAPFILDTVFIQYKTNDRR